jgi:hypothetical protein
MTTARELLSAALDSDGVICVFVQKGDRRWNKFFPAGAYEQAENYAAQKDREGHNCYFCTATLATANSREAANAHAVKLFKLDLDVGPEENKFASQQDAGASLRAFCKTVGLPRPTVVSSGGGLHCYWFMDEALVPADAKAMQERFKALTIHHGLKADHSTTADIVRVLRLPGTHNHKDPANPRLVQMLTPIATYGLDELCDIVDAAYARMPNAMPPQLFAGQDISHLQSEDDATKKLAGNDPNKVLVFSKLLRLSLEGNGCAQIKRMWNNREHASEPEWRDLLGFAAKAQDRDKAIHDISELHESYSPSETEKKANEIPAPHNCAYFQTGENKDTCKGCKHAKKINSPVSLGMVTQKAVGEDNIVIAQNKNVDEAPRQYVIPPLPHGYFRGKHGGIYKQGKDEGEDTLLCHEDFYAVANLKDGDNYLIELCVNTGKHDGVKQFMLPLGGLFGEALKKLLPEKGVRPPHVATGFANLMQYVSEYHRFLRDQKPSVPVKHQFGWTNAEFDSFVIGEREIKRHPGGAITVEYSQPSDELLSICDRFTRKGSLDAWRDTVNVYARDKRLAPHRFGVLMGFAGPLIPLLDLKGMVVNLYGERSGHGKTTVLETQATIWGSPDAMRSHKDTAASRLHTLGCYKNIPAGYDEMTRVPVEDLQDFLYQITSGQGKDRMEAQTNRLRVNHTNWATAVTITANTSFVDRITSMQSGGEGVLMRLLEVHFEEENRNVLEKEEADRVFNVIKHNYGHAGEIFIKHVMAKGVNVVRAMLNEERIKIDADTNMTNQERFWSGAVTAAYVGGLLAREAGLINFDMEDMRVWLVELVKSLRSRQTSPQAYEENQQVLSAYVQQNINSMYVYSHVGGADADPVMQSKPHGVALGRVDVYKNGAVIAMLCRGPFNEYLSSNQKLSIDGFMRAMANSGMPLEDTRGRIALVANESKEVGKGDKGLMNAVRVYKVVMQNGVGENHESGNAAPDKVDGVQQ